MIGLLYKEFIATKGKLFLILSGIHLILLITIPFISSETEVSSIYMYSVYLLVALSMIMGYSATRLIRSDNQKQIEYFLGTTVNASGYVMSKFVFLFLTYIFVAIMIVAEGLIVKSNMTLDVSTNMMNDCWKIVPIGIGISLFISSLELLLCYVFKIDGNNVLTGFAIVVMFVFLAYIFFGDLSVFEKINMTNLIKNHKKVIAILQIVIPVAAVAFTMLSCVVSIKFFKRNYK